MKRRALLIAGVGVLGGCLQNGTENTQGSDGTDQEEDDNGTDQEDESNGTDEEPDSNTTGQDNTTNGTTQDNTTNGTTQDNTTNGTTQDNTTNGTTQDNTRNGSAQEEDGNGTDQGDRESRTYEIEAETSSESPIRHEFEVTQPDIHSPDSPLTLTVSISNTTDETIAYGDTDNAVGLYLVHDEFILVPKGEHEYSFDEDERLWFATKTLDFTVPFDVAELDPDEARSQELVMIRQPHKEFPETTPSEFEFTTSLEIADEVDNMETGSEYPVAFHLVET